jgi:hypothetical protein
MKPLTVIKKADLDFGNVVVAGAGTATVDPVTGAVTTTGLVSSAGALGRRALFTATGSRNSVVLIRLPKNPIALTRIGGTETLSVSSWTLDGTTNRRVPPSLAFDFGVGATVTVPAGQADGTYVGTFSVDVQYP